MPLNRQIHLISRPSAAPSLENFSLVSSPTPGLADGEVLVRHHFLSLDPYMRGRMNDAKNYAQPQALNETMIGGTVGEVLESRNPGFAVGDKVVGMGGWQEYGLVPAAMTGMLRKVDDSRVPLSAYLGAVGMPGVTAYYGLVHIIAPKAGDTLVVSAASGAVGSAFGALAKARGCRVVGVAGGADKCAYVVNELGFDACVDYKQHPDAASLTAALQAVCPQGVEGYFENVGGMVMNAVMPLMNAFGRVAVCGMIAGYNGAPIPLALPQLILRERLRVQGFIVSEQPQVWPTALAELGGLVASGALRVRETVALGIESAPQAFLGLLSGRNFGKQLVKLI
jgi:NADPH-dependent curcumin reductase CurA